MDVAFWPSARRALFSTAILALAVVPMQRLAAQTQSFVAVGGTVLTTSGSGTSTLAGAGSVGVIVGPVLLNGGVTVSRSNGVTSTSEDGQLGLILMRRKAADGKKYGAFAIGGGIWHPQNGDALPMVSFMGYTASPTNKFTIHTMGGYIIPKSGGKGTLVVRLGLGLRF